MNQSDWSSLEQKRKHTNNNKIIKDQNENKKKGRYRSELQDPKPKKKKNDNYTYESNIEKSEKKIIMID